MINIGVKIKQIREHKQYSQEYVATKLGISQNAYSRIESNQTKLTTERLKQIAEILDVEQIDLLNTDPIVFNFTNNKIAKGYSNVSTIYEENEAHKSHIDSLRHELSIKNEQIQQLLKLLETIKQN